MLAHLPDMAALAFFVLCWLIYHNATAHGVNVSLNRRMDVYRLFWMREMQKRDVRMVDTAIAGSLQNGAAFFASTSLLAIGATATLLRAGDDALKIAADLPFGIEVSRAQWEMKVIGLLLIFGYAFFKFAWSYRLFNFAAILIGATPGPNHADPVERERIAGRAGRMNMVAGSHFTRGQRAFFFALAYVGWFFGPWAFMAMTAAVMVVMWRRQFTSDARDALLYEPRIAPPDETSTRAPEAGA